MYRLPRMNGFMRLLGKTAVFSMLHWNSGYWKVETKKEVRGMSSFTSHYGPHRVLQILARLRNNASTFQYMMDVAVSMDKWQLALSHLNGNFIYTCSILKHSPHMKHELKVMPDELVTLKIKKGYFSREKINYQGQHIRPRGLGKTSHTTDVFEVLNAPVKWYQIELVFQPLKSL